MFVVLTKSRAFKAVSKNSFDVVTIVEGKVSNAKQFENDSTGYKKLIKHLSKKSITHVCLEATGHYHLDLALALNKPSKIKLMVINPRVAHNFSKVLNQKSKTDETDAYVLAQYTLRMEFEEWQAPDEALFAIRSCSRHLSQQVKMQTALKNQLHAYQSTDFTPDFIVESMVQNLKQLKQQIDQLVEHTIELISGSVVAKNMYDRLVSINGIADRTAIKLIGELALLDPNMKPKQLVAHAGLNPTIVQSGSSINKKSRISKTGNKYIREALYMTALRMAHHDLNVSAYYQHLINDNHLAKRQAICAVMRKLLMSINCMLRQNTGFDPQRFYRLEESAHSK